MWQSGFKLPKSKSKASIINHYTTILLLIERRWSIVSDLSTCWWIDNREIPKKTRHNWDSSNNNRVKHLGKDHTRLEISIPAEEPTIKPYLYGAFHFHFQLQDICYSLRFRMSCVPTQPSIVAESSVFFIVICILIINPLNWSCARENIKNILTQHCISLNL